MSQSIEHLTCTESWSAADDELIVIEDSGSRSIGNFPIAFLEQGCANTSQVAYLVRICRMLLFIPATHDLSIARHDIPVVDNDKIEAGLYILNGQFESRPGPSGKSRSRSFRDTDTNSTNSRSSRSFANQSHFKMELLARDGECLISGEDVVESLVACHIIPFSLGQ